MARSFHTTRRDLLEHEKYDMSDEAARVAKIEKLRESLQTKRRVKRQVRAQRRRAELPPPPTRIEAIPIRTAGSTDYLVYPTPLDLRAVMAALPGGTADGLAGITLGLGAQHQRDYLAEAEREASPDPYTGRLGCEHLPGVYYGLVWGAYCPGPATIELCAAVCAPDTADLDLWLVLIKLRLLATFVHELAHHFDFTSRVGRGRWRYDDHDKIECYAEHVQHGWTANCVIPYLKAAYPASLARLSAWLEQRFGRPIPLSLLAGDPRAHAKDGMILANAMFDTANAFEECARALAAGEDPLQVRLAFARDLHYVGEYDLADGIIETVLRRRPKDLEAMTLQADILEHRQQYQQALHIAREALDLQPDYPDAMRVVVHACQGLKDWRNMFEAAERLVAVLADDPWARAMAIRDRALASIELSDYEAASRDITELAAGGRRSRIQAKRLLELLEETRRGGQPGQAEGD